MKEYGDVTRFSHIREYQYWAEHVTNLRRKQDIPEYNALVNQIAILMQRVPGTLAAGDNITLTYNDEAGTLTIASTAPSGGGNSYFPSGW